MGRVDGKVAIVTGAGSGIGKATANLLAREGAAVVIADINPAAGAQVADKICGEGGRASFVQSDVSKAQDVERMVNHALEQFQKLDILHNNAFWNRQNSPIVDTTEEDWDRTIDVTLKSVYLGCKYAIPVMIRNGGGSIVNTASIAGIHSSANLAAYVAAKGGVAALTRSVALDYGSKGIRSNAVCPGTTETPLTASVLADPERRAMIESRILVGRVGQPEDIAQAVLYLASDESAYMTGSLLVIDGGRMIF